MTCKSDTASDLFSAAVAFFSCFGRYNPGSGSIRDAKNEIPVIMRLITIGIGDSRNDMVGAADPQPTAIVMHIIVTDPTLVGGTLSSIISNEILIHPPNIPTIKNTAA